MSCTCKTCPECRITLLVAGAEALQRVTGERDAAIAAIRLAEPALRTLRDGHCDCLDCKYTKALDALVEVLKGAAV